MITQEQIEFFFYDLIKELRDNNIPILNNFCEKFADYKYEDELREENYSTDEESDFESEELN